MTNFAGKLWVAEADGSIVKVDLTAFDDISVGLGVVGRVHQGARLEFARAPRQQRSVAAVVVAHQRQGAHADVPPVHLRRPHRLHGLQEVVGRHEGHVRRAADQALTGSVRRPRPGTTGRRTATLRPMPAAIAYAALLRGINVGGVKLLMTDLARLCEREGFDCVKTYIASGNVVFTSTKKEAAVRDALEAALAGHMRRPVPVLVRSAAELEATVAANPFPGVAGNRLLVFFLPDPPPKNVLAGVVAPDGEALAVRGRELYVHYPNGMGRSKLKVPLWNVGTSRNLNTVVKLAALTRALG